MSQIVEVLLAKSSIPQEEIDDFAGQIKEHNMAELFANFKAYDVQAAHNFNVSQEKTVTPLLA